MDEDVIALIAAALASTNGEPASGNGLPLRRAGAVIAALRASGYEVVRRPDAVAPEGIPPQELNASNDG